MRGERFVAQVKRYLVSLDECRSQGLVVRGYDAVIVGSGIAGLWTALQILSAGDAKIAIVSKASAHECNTYYAQGGIAAVLYPTDSPEMHFNDTVEAGAGLCNTEAVWVLVTETPLRIHELRSLGVRFEEEDGKLKLTREGAHRVSRIVYARGDRTGYEIEQVLLRKAREKGVDLLEWTFAIDLLTMDGECFGVLAWSEHDRCYMALLGSVTFICTGGAGQLYESTTNAKVATGDGLAMAYRAGATLADLEFIQFHPTALYEIRSPRLLISETVRGEGGILLNINRERFMPRYHPMGELAPRDVVCRAILNEMRRTNSEYVFIDVTSLDGDLIRKRFPYIYEQCLERGYNIAKQPIPVAPAAHYIMGGVSVDLYGRTSIRRLYAVGEVACTGLHGANRLASNSLNEALVFGKRAATDALQLMKNATVNVDVRAFLEERSEAKEANIDFVQIHSNLQKLMSESVGISREKQGLEAARSQIEQWLNSFKHVAPTAKAWEVANMLLVCRLIVESALMRTESRGAHFREDYPDRDDERWLARIVHASNRIGDHIFVPGKVSISRVAKESS